MLLSTRRFTRSRGATRTDPVRIQVFPSQLGWMAAAWRGRELNRFAFGHATPGDAMQVLNVTNEIREEAEFLEPFAERMTRFAARGADSLLDIPLALERFTPFQRAVLERCRHIPAGQILTYAELARAAGCPGGARAVGNVMAANPFPLIVPCHRVVGSAGGLGGYSGPTGLAMKRRLLEREGITLLPRNGQSPG